MAFLYTLAILVSAFLLFLVEPMFARMLLPLLGGSPEVWNTAVVFYQVALLVGYLYAHFATRVLGARKQALLHLPLLALPFLVLPLAIPVNTAPPLESNPIGWLLLFMAARLGLPFAILSATSPLLQRWFAELPHPAAHDPYFLYAASNIGSLIALLSYPILIEPRLGLAVQSRTWSLGYSLFAGLIVVCAVVLWRTRGRQSDSRQETVTPGPVDSDLTWPRRVRWVALAAIPSGLMLSVTTYLSIDVPSFPLLWVIPLALYLLAFIIGFARRRVIPSGVLRILMPAFLIFVTFSATLSSRIPVWVALPLHLAGFFVVALTCDSALAGDRPSARHLTEFYLWLSLGGAVGGILNTLVAPRIFPLPLEYPLWLAAAALLVIAGVESGSRRRWAPVVLPGVLGTVLLLAVIKSWGLAASGLSLVAGLVFGLPALFALGLQRRRGFIAIRGIVFLVVAFLYAVSQGNVLYVERSFFGINLVTADKNPAMTKLVHGTTLHGVESGDAARKCEPLTYYSRTGPIGQAVASLQSEGRTGHVGVVGLGAGSLAGYTRPGEEWVFYEIDPAVERIARDPAYFHFLSDCAPETGVILGDARLTLTRQPAERHDLLILDAYSSDSIPVHLITREALALYTDKLGPGGVLAFHITNRYFDLKPALAVLADDAGLVSLWQSDRGVSKEEIRSGKSPSEWVLMARNPSDFGAIGQDPRWQPLSSGASFPLWTDDYSSVLLAWR